jgi:anaerobic ribonucleoside-triphosphate reductase activating protein
MKIYNIEIVLQEVPGEISICFTITGCYLHCSGCHSPHLWNKNYGTTLSHEKYIEVLTKYKGFATCVLFMGGEWHEEILVKYLKIAKKMNYKTCLYSGLENVSNNIMNQLTYVKTGQFKKELGGLDSHLTNQKFMEVKSKKILNELFIKN